MTKKPEWKTISDARRSAEAVQTAKLREARLARDAAAPPPEPRKVVSRRANKPA